MTITLTREEAQQVLDALQCATPPTFSAKIVEDWQSAVEFLRARLAQPEPELVAKMKELLEVQGRDGNWNLDPYMQGMYNGMELMVALAERRDPVFRKAPENWLSAPPQRERVQFPTMLRKMWSGTEVQAWLDENVNQENNNE